jgi:TonB-linked SusC/RagA family outer membrane protein
MKMFTKTSIRNVGKMFCKAALLLVATLFFTTLANAQNRTITGKVVDAKGQTPLSSANVTVKGTAAVRTKGDGSFSLSVPPNATTITISYAGYTPQTIKLTSSSSYDVTLVASETKDEEVVVVGYGSAKKKDDVVGSVTSVNASTLQERPSANVLDALQGRVAGLQIFTSSGEPSATSSARINGVGSLTAGTTPLYVLDGIPVSPGALVSLNSEDYQSVSVLTDASAVSIYGSRAANGVIYFTSKKGSATKSRITLNTQYATSSLLSNTTNFFGQVMNAKELSDFFVQIGQLTPTAAATLLAPGYDTKWSDVYYKSNTPTKQIDLSISGGGEKTTYYISGGYFDQEGLTYRSRFKRFTLRSNVNTVVNKYVTLGLNLVGGYDNRQTNPDGANSTNRGLALLAQPWFTPNDPATGRRYELIPGWNRYHPEYRLDKLRNSSDNVQFTPQAYLQITPIKNLTLKTTAGMEAYDFTNTAIQLPSYTFSPNNGNVFESYSRQVTRTVNSTIEYKFDIKDRHSVNVLAGNEYIDDKFKSFNGSSAGQTDDRLVLIGAGPNLRNAGSSYSAYTYLSYFARAGYNLDSKYFLDLSARNDQSSRFGKENRSANFWAVGAMWKVKKEKFLENVDWLSDLTVKGSIGTSGNSSIGNYASLGLVGTNQYDGASGLGISSPDNPNLSWETQKLSSATILFSLYRKANFKVEYYQKTTTDMLLNVPYPFTSGFASVLTNVGALQNNGINVTVDYDVIRKKDAYLTPYFNFNYNKNKVTELFQGKDFFIQPNTGVAWAIGQPVSYFYPVWKGVNPANGLPEWYTPNADPNKVYINQQDATKITNTFSTAALQQNTGIQRYAPWAGGFGISGGLKGFYLQADFSFVKGKYLINNDQFFFDNPGQFPGFNQSRAVRDYWKAPGDVTQFPKLGQQFTQFDSRLIQDASFMRLKVLSLGYAVPQNIVKKSGFVNGAKFYVTGRNVFTVTKYKGPDPEIDTNVTLGANPNTRQLSVGLELQF